MHRIWIAGSLLAIAMAIAAIGASGASAFPGSFSPQIPGIGNATGLDGPAPRVEVFGGRTWVRRAGTTGVEVRCTTSTAMGCSGTLELVANGSIPVGTARFELPEGESEGIHVELRRQARLRAARRTGLKLMARACASDSLGRAACDAAAVTLHAIR